MLLLACSGEVQEPVGPPPAPPLPPPPGAPLPGVQPTGGEIQDDAGFPIFHAWLPAPAGAPVIGRGEWSKPVKLSALPGGGYRPQIAVGPQDELHVLFYDRSPRGDIIRHRIGPDWTEPVRVGFDKNRNWGPDLVVRDDSSVVVVFDHALPNFQSRGWITEWTGSWSEPAPLTPRGKREVGSGHVAHGQSEDLAYVWIEKALGPEHNFQAHGRWRIDGEWGEVSDFSDGKANAWHTNVERRPDGSVLAGWDLGVGGAEGALTLVQGRGGRWGQTEEVGVGERPHFAFGDEDHVTWFHKKEGKPLAVYVMSGKPGDWGPKQTPSEGYGGYHFDPDIAINADGVRCLVWGWDAGQDAELVYSLDRGQGWEAPRKVAEVAWGEPGLPSIGVDSEGAFHVVWNQGVRGDSHIYYAKLVP